MVDHARFAAPPMRLLDPERDGPALHAIFGDEDCCRYLPRPAFASIDETIAQLRTWNENAEDTSWVTVDGDGQATGRISLYRTKDDLWDAACMIAPTARGHGLARRALAYAIEHVFAHKNALKVTADVDPDNTASARTFEQLGFQLEGRLRALWTTHIGVRDSLIYGLLRTDPRPWN
jgi:ribosomal-protein-alanine N-acetyltransferase